MSQTAVFNGNGTLFFYRWVWTEGCSDFCSTLCTSPNASSWWGKCCTTDLCNTQQVPADITSLAALEQYSPGMTQAECAGAPYITSKFARLGLSQIQSPNSITNSSCKLFLCMSQTQTAFRP